MSQDTTTPERRPEQRCRTCFVQGCKSGYKSCKETHSLFRAPVEPERLAAWSRNIRRRDRPLTHDCVICDRHFDERFIERTFRIKIKGEIVEIPRERPQLTKDAIPTIFPEAPKYYTKSLPKKRKERNLCNQKLPLRKRRRKKSTAENGRAGATSTPAEAHNLDAGGSPNQRAETTADKSVSSSERQVKREPCNQLNGRTGSTEVSSDALDCDAGSPMSEHVETTKERVSFSKLRIPPGWSEITLADKEGLFLYAQCESDAAEPYCSVVMVKTVRIRALADDVDTVVAEVHLRGNIWCQAEIATREDAEELIDSTNKLALCPGVGLQPLSGDCPAYNGKFFSRDCTLFADSNQGRPCGRCKYQRRLIQNQISRRRKGYEVVMTRTSDMRWRVEVSRAAAKRDQVTEEVAVESVEVLQDPGTEKPKEQTSPVIEDVGTKRVCD